MKGAKDGWGQLCCEITLYREKKGLQFYKNISIRWINSPQSKVNVVKDSSRMVLDLVKIRANDLREYYDGCTN